MQDDRDDLIFDREEKQVFVTQEFEGPLDLLLYQIQKAEINIYNIPIAEITQQFLSYIEEHKTRWRLICFTSSQKCCFPLQAR